MNVPLWKRDLDLPFPEQAVDFKPKIRFNRVEICDICPDAESEYQCIVTKVQKNNIRSREFQNA